MKAKQADERDKDGDKPFKGVKHGKGQIDLKHLGDSVELRPVEIHMKEDGGLDDQPVFVIVMVGTRYIPMAVYGQITLDMLNGGLKEIGYKIVKS